MERFLLSEVKKMEGSLLAIGLTNDKIKNAIIENDKITICNLLEEPAKGFRKYNFLANAKARKVNIKKLRKTFKKKKTNNIICDYKTIREFTKWFVRDSVYINNGKLYIYGKKEELEKIIKKYNRYTSDARITKEKDGCILIVNNENTKNNKIKDMGYWFKDTGETILDALTLILAN